MIEMQRISRRTTLLLGALGFLCVAHTTVAQAAPESVETSELGGAEGEPSNEAAPDETAPDEAAPQNTEGEGSAPSDSDRITSGLSESPPGEPSTLTQPVSTSAEQEEPESAANAIAEANESESSAPNDGLPEEREDRMVRITPGVHLFGQYILDIQESEVGTDWFHRFDMDRVWLSLGATYRGARARIRLEGARVAEGDGRDPFVVVFREVWAGYRAFDALEVRLGMLPKQIAPGLTNQWGLRALSRIGPHFFGLLVPADMGATLTYDLPRGIGRVGAGFYNGEGYLGTELNRGKNAEFFAELHLPESIEQLRPLTLTLAMELGAQGTSSVNADRFVGSIAWVDRWVGAGISVTYARGFQGDRDREGLVIDTWIRSRPFWRLDLSARLAHFLSDFDTTGASQTRAMLAVGAEWIPGLSSSLAFDIQRASDAAANPAFERFRLRIVVEGRFEPTIALDPSTL